MGASSPRGYALQLLKKRLRSAWELDQALLRRGVEAEERTKVITELTEAGLIDDQRFAKAWVHDRDRFAPRGAYLLRQELLKKGIDKEIIRQVLQDRLEDEEEPIDELAQARELAERRFALYRGLPEETQKRRVMAFLLRRGFSLDTVRRILNA